MSFASFVRALPQRRAKTARFAPSRPSLEELYRDHLDFVFRQARRLGAPGIDAEDVTQDVFLIVARKLEIFDCAQSSITTWLYGITFNVVRAQRRSMRKRKDFECKEERDNNEVSAPPPDSLEMREAQRVVHEILDQLPHRKREAFILAEIEGLSCEEIADRVGAKTETVWSRLHYARREFADRLEMRMQKERERFL
jgi:RNA polymerase sigma-70 factor (ECF subfamily)